jgi:hypothetical protein
LLTEINVPAASSQGRIVWIWRTPGKGHGDSPRCSSRAWLASLWRFAISNLPEAQGVTLGSFEPAIRDILFVRQDVGAIQPVKVRPE